MKVRGSILLTLSESSRKSLEHAVTVYESSRGSVAKYLAARGISDETARSYRLGYVESPLPGDSEYEGRLAIPYICANGSVVDIRYRATGDAKPKYLSRVGAAPRMFSVSAFLNAGETIWITEGEVDAITLNQCDIPSVGIPGAMQWQRHWALLFADFDSVKVICDGDQAGKDFGKRISQEIEGATILHLPEGKDVNDIYVEEGLDALREAVVA